MSVCVPTIGRPSLGLLIRSLAEAAAALGATDRTAGPLDVVVAAAPASGALGLAAAPGVDLRVVPNPAGTASAGRNAAAAAARGQTLLFLDDDCRVAPDHLARLAARLAAEPGVEAWSGLTLRDPGDDPLQRAWAALFDGPFTAPRRAAWVRWAPSTNLAVRRRALDALGGFAALPLPVGGEDLDLGLRLAGAGLGPIRCAPELVAHHAPEEPGALLLKAARYGASHQLVGDLHPGYAGQPRPRALLFPDTPEGRLLRAFQRGAERVHRPPRRYDADAMADPTNGVDGRAASARGPAAEADAAAEAVAAAGHLVLSRPPADPGEGRLLVYLRGQTPWRPLALPPGWALDRVAPRAS